MDATNIYSLRHTTQASDEKSNDALLRIGLESVTGTILCIYVTSIIALSASTATFLFSNLLAALLVGSFGFQVLVSRHTHAETSDRIYLPWTIGLLTIFTWWLLATSLLAIDMDEAIKRTLTVGQLLIVAVVSLNTLIRLGALWPIPLGFVLGNLIAAMTELSNSGFQLFVVEEVQQSGSLLLNANGYGTALLLGIISAWYLSHKVKPLILKGLLGVCMVLFAQQIFFASGSRDSIVLTAIFLPGYFLLHSIGNSRARVFSLVSLVAVTVGMYYIGYSLFEQTPFYSRFDTLDGEISEGRRRQLADFGLEKWGERPLVGHGTNQYRILTIDAGFINVGYSHNNFIELLVNNGLIGTILFYGAHVMIAITLMRFYLQSRATPTLIVMTLLLASMLISDTGTVSYYNKMYWMALVLLISYVSFQKTAENESPAQPKPLNTTTNYITHRRI